MRFVFILVLILGVGLAGVAVNMAQNLIAQAQVERDALLAAQADAPQLINVVVANRSIRYGERIVANDMRVIKWPVENLPKGAFHMVVGKDDTPADTPVLFALGETRPRAALRSFEKYEPILAAKVTDPGVDAGLNANLTPGMRAFTINVNASSGVSGFLRPGDRVDVYWFGTAGGTQVTKRILPGVRLIAIDQNADADRTEETVIARTVTVEVTPEVVAALTQAQATGSLSLSLVGSEDVVTDTAIAIDQNPLLGIEVLAAPEPVAEERVCTIFQNKGGQRVETVIPCTD